MTDYLNRVRQVITTTGTGTTIILDTVSDGDAFFTMAEAGATNGATYNYVITDGNDVEIHENETWTSASRQLTRGTPTLSKISGTAGTSKINLSGSARLRIFETAGDLKKVLRANFDQSFSGPELARLLGNLGGTATGIALFTAANAAAAFTAIKQAASQSATGVIEIATNAEARTGTDADRAMTPANHAAAHKPAFRAETSGSQAITAGVWTASTQLTDSGNASRFDSDGCFSNPRFTPNVAGFYQISGVINVPSSGTVGVGIFKNGSLYVYDVYEGGSATFTALRAISQMIYFNGTTDYVELVAFTNFSGGSINAAVFSGFRLFD